MIASPNSSGAPTSSRGPSTLCGAVGRRSTRSRSGTCRPNGGEEAVMRLIGSGRISVTRQSLLWAMAQRVHDPTLKIGVEGGCAILSTLCYALTLLQAVAAYLR